MDKYPEASTEKVEPEIIYVDVPDENEPMVSSSAASAIGMFGVYDTLRNGRDVTMPSLGIVFRDKKSKER